MGEARLKAEQIAAVLLDLEAAGKVEVEDRAPVMTPEMVEEIVGEWYDQRNLPRLSPGVVAAVWRSVLRERVGATESRESQNDE